MGLRVKRVQANEPGAGRTCGMHHSTAGHTQNSKPYLHSILLAKVFKRCLKGVEFGHKLTCHWPRSLPMTGSGD